MLGFHQINALSSCCYLSNILLQRRGMDYAKIIHKKEKALKNGQVSEVPKQWVLRCPPEKRKKKSDE
jgi:hypothetical protein